FARGGFLGGSRATGGRGNGGQEFRPGQRPGPGSKQRREGYTADHGGDILADFAGESAGGGAGIQGGGGESPGGIGRVVRGGARSAVRRTGGVHHGGPDAQRDEFLGKLAGMVRGARTGLRRRGATGNAAAGGGAESGSQVCRGGGSGPGGGHGAAVRRDRERRACGRDRVAAATGRPPGPERTGGASEMGVHARAARRCSGGRGCHLRDTLPSGPATETEAATATMNRQNLIIDADDTLWENNIYFERAFEEFVAFLDHSSMSPREVRDILDEMEGTNARIHGYGSANFGRNLRQCYEHLVEREIREVDLATVMGFARRILECPMEVIPGVRETLAYLAGRHDLTLFTKGHVEEQKLKIDSSGLGVFFEHTAIVKEKDRAAYRRLVAERGMEAADTWRIGNSPKSDVNPALEAGLNAVFVPHEHTWVLEKQDLQPGKGRLLVLEKCEDLRERF